MSKVRDDAGEPLTVSVPDGSDSAPLRFCRTDVTLGDYHKALPSGTYDVTATVDGYPPQTEEGVSVGAEETVEVSFVFGTSGVEESAGSVVRTGELVATPNPVSTACSFGLPVVGVEGSLEIYDISGRRVETIPVGRGSASANWNCRSSAGHRVPQGVYLASIRVDGRVYTTRIVVSR